MTDVEFREAEPHDLRAIIDLLVDDDLGRYREIGNDTIPREYSDAFTAVMCDPNQLMVVGELRGELVACMQITFIPGLSRKGAWRGQLESIRVASHLRGKGLGTSFLRWAIDQCRERGCRFVQLTSDRKRADAQKFYEQLGFVGSHTGFKLEI